MTDTYRPVLPCPRCQAPLPWQSLRADLAIPCGGCGTSVLGILFPSFLRDPAKGEAASDLRDETEASCFYHAGKEAVVACENCGRFLCALCQVEIAGRRLCVPCVDSARKSGRLRELTRHRVMYDEIALALAVVPMLCPPLTVFTAPASLFYAVRHWRSPLSILPRTRVRFVAAIGLSLPQVAAWVVLFVWLLTK